MKKLQVGLMAIGMMAAIQVNAQETRKEMPKQTPEQRFAKLDANSDGFLSLEELKKGKGEEAKDPEAKLKKLDSNKDGKVTKDEFLAKKEVHAAKMEAKENAPKLTPEQRFSKMDANQDGALTVDELKKGKGEEAKDAETKFKKLDANADGKVSKEEFVAKKEMRDAKKEAAPMKRN